MIRFRRSSSTPFAASVMLLKPTKPHSIATQLVLLFTLAAAILLGCALGGFYWLVIRHASAEDDAVLADKIRVVRAELREPDGLQALSAELNTRHAGESTAYWVRVLDRHSRVQTETPRMNAILPAAVFSAPEPSTILAPKNYLSARRLFSLVTVDELINGQPYL